MHDAIKDRVSKRGGVLTRLPIPSVLEILGTKDGGGLLPPVVEQLGDILLLAFGRFHQELFIHNEEDGVGIFRHCFLVCSGLPGVLQVKEDI